MKLKYSFLVFGLFILAGLLVPDIANADLVSSLNGVKLKLTGVILPSSPGDSRLKTLCPVLALRAVSRPSRRE